MTHTPTIERLHELFDLRPDGTLIRRTTPCNSVKIGQCAGWHEPNGYCRVGIDGRKYLVHRVVFAMTHGRWPVEKIDHENGEHDTNEPGNLREATQRKNMQNMERHRTGHLPGATFKKDRGKWRARARLGNKQIHLGYHATEETAHAAYMAWCAKYG